MSLTDPFGNPLAVTTDYSDYAPGSTAYFTASNIAIGGTVTFDVDHVVNVGGDGVAGTADDTLANDLSGTDPWNVTDGGAGDLDGLANGIIVTSWSVNQDALYQTFQLTATDSSGATATATFTDALPKLSEDFAYTATPDTVVDMTTADALADNPQDVGGGAFVSNMVVGASSGSGNFHPFVRMSQAGNGEQEEGYNSLAKADQTVVFDGEVHQGNLVANGVGNPTVTLDSLAVVTVDGVDYYEFVLDLHQNDGVLSVDAIQIYQSDLSTLGTTTDLAFDPAAEEGGTDAGFGSNATLVWDLDAGGDKSIMADSNIAGHGSGTPDLALLVPTSAFDPANGNYIYFFSAMGGHSQDVANGDSGGAADATFEEWSALIAAAPGDPTISLDKQVSVDGGDSWFDVGPDVLEGPSLLGSAGSDLQYKFIITNTGTVTLTNVTLTDLPDIPGLDGDIGTLAPGASVTVTVSGEFAAGYHIDTGTVISAEGAVDSDQADYYGATPGVTLDKGVSGDGGTTFYQLGDDDTVPTILVGHTVTFEAVVDNTDQVIDVTGASVTDDNPSDTFDGPDTIAAGSTGNVYDGVSTTAVAGLQTDTATFHGTATDSGGHTSDWHADDSASYFGADPSVTVVKEVSVDGGTTWFDANDPTGPLLLESGPDPMFRFTVTNTGNVELTNLTLSDSDFDLNGAEDGTDITIASLAAANAGDDDVYQTTITAAWAAGQHTDTATVAGSFADDVGNSADVGDEDDANYFGAVPEIEVDKTTTGTDTHGVSHTGDNITVEIGTTVTWTYTVTNTGNIALSDIVVTDDGGPGADFNPTLDASTDVGSDGILSVGESWTYTATGTATPNQYTNVATADGTWDEGQQVSDTDDSGYVGIFRTDYTGLTAGFWSQHLQAWDGDLSTNKNNAGLVPGVLWNKDVLPLVDIDPFTTGVQKGVLLGDSNADGVDNGGEVTLALSLDIAKQLVSASISDKSDARLNLLQQAVAAELNIYNHADDPGKLDAGTGDDLLGTAVKWLTGQLVRADGDVVPSAWNIDNNSTPGVLTQTTEIVLNSKGITFTDGAVKTSSYDWTGDFVIVDKPGTGSDVWASGEDLKDALEAFNTGALVTSANGQYIGWNDNGVISDIQVNDQDGLWAVLINDLHIGHYA
jgi:uncharacterized repeat protein (TIGR01451 family)